MLHSCSKEHSTFWLQSAFSWRALGLFKGGLPRVLGCLILIIDHGTISLPLEPLFSRIVYDWQTGAKETSKRSAVPRGTRLGFEGRFPRTDGRWNRVSIDGAGGKIVGALYRAALLSPKGEGLLEGCRQHRLGGSRATLEAANQWEDRGPYEEAVVVSRKREARVGRGCCGRTVSLVG